MVGRIALHPLLRFLRSARTHIKWADLKFLIQHHLFARRMTEDHNPVPPLLFQMATGYWLSQAVYVAAKLGIADLLENGPKSSAELAGATCCHPPSLFRVLRALSSVGIVTHVGYDSFSLARSGNALRSNVPGSLRSVLITLGEIHYKACGELLHTVQTGSPAFNRVFGAGLFEYLQRNRQAAVAFSNGMSDIARLLANAILLAYDFSTITTIVDIGGGEGELLQRILEMYPGMKGILFDLSTEHRSPPCPATKTGSFSNISGDFFESVPTNVEAHLLCGVIHDWSDELAGIILGNCRKAMAINGRLLIVETIVPETNSASFSKLLDINMMVMTSGRERTNREFRSLLEAADFKVTRIIPTLAPQSIIEAFPV